jgi:zinc transporter
MAQLRPMPVFLNEPGGADRGLICGYELASGQAPREISADGIVQALADKHGVTWLHFNLSDARARRWLVEASFVPEALREVLQEHDGNRRVELVDRGLLLVISDFTYEESAEPVEMVPLWCFADQHTLLTARLHPVKSADDLRLHMRRGASAASGIELLGQLLDIRTARVKRLVYEMTAHLDDIEDEILAGNIKQQRAQLGRTRRLCARLRRELAPERSDMSKFLHRPAEELPAADQEILGTSNDALGFALEEIAELYERAKLLQEELASRVAENTNRNLYVLSILTAVLLPMTLVTGVFGMNVAGMPGLHGGHSLWWVMFLIVTSGAVTLALLFWRKLL